MRNDEVPWGNFSPDDYWHLNYETMQPVDQEIIRRVSLFFVEAFASRPRAQWAIDIGSGTNLYPALLMLPWTERILLADHSDSNVRWLRRYVDDEDPGWTWQPFWQELRELEDYNRITEPQKQLRVACAGRAGHAGIEQHSVFNLPRARWLLGTMFFVAESISEDRTKFSDAIEGFVGALAPGAPFAAAFMAGSRGYSVNGIHFPAMNISVGDVTECFMALDASDLSVELTQTPDLVRDEYDGMIVATGIVGNR